MGREEERERSLQESLDWFDNAACGLLRTSDDGLVLAVNRTFCAWVGRSCDGLVGKRRFSDLLTVGGRIFHETHWLPLLQMQGSISEVKLEVIHADGSTLPMVVNALRRERDGAMIHEVAAFVARDRDKYERELVVSRKRLEEMVSESNRLREEAKDRALFAEQMIGIVSHDLRNPINVISMAVSILARQPLGEAQLRTVERIRRASEHGASLIADLLDFTQARLRKRLHVDVRPIDMHRVVGDAVEELSQLHPARTISHARSGDGPCSADPHRLAQIVGNLVSNAVAYGDPQSPVTVTSTIEPQIFSVAVHNFGMPIPEAAREVIFQAMVRGTGVGGAERSVGLGLYIVRELVKAHGGNIELASTAQEGTTFRATFPRSS